MNDSAQQPYVRFPSVRGQILVFAAEDDLWTVPVTGGAAWRLTAGHTEVAHPHLSPGGDLLAFVGMDEGPEEVHVMPADGGESRRLTFDGANTTVVGWDGDAIIYASNARRPFDRDFRLHQVDARTGLSRELPYGAARSVAFGPDGVVVVGRGPGGNIVRGLHNAEPATWKRYRGGMAGTLWIDGDGDGEFEPLLDGLDGNLAHPCWVGDRLYLISDHEGVGNVFSCALDGTDLRRHSDHDDFYARGLTSDGQRLVYHSGGRLYLLHPQAERAQEVAVELPTSRQGRARRFVAAKDHLENVALGPGGDDLALITRGRSFTLAHWDGPVRQHGQADGVRYRLAQWLADHERLIAVAGDDAPDEQLVVLHADGIAAPSMVELDVGRPIEMLANPRKPSVVAIINHRNEVVIIDVDRAPASAQTVDVCEHLPPCDLAWSPDGRWVAYTTSVDPTRTAIRIVDSDDGQAYTATQPVLRDSRPAWDPAGRYLYFLSLRDFDPVHDELHFDRGFPLGGRPMLLTLRADLPSPFLAQARPTAEDGPSDGSDAGADRVHIDLDGMAQRTLAFPVPIARYQRIAGLVDKVMLSRLPVEGALGSSPFGTGGQPKATLETFDLTTHRVDAVLDPISDFAVDSPGTTLLVKVGDRLRVLPAGEQPPSPDGDPDQPGRSTGWVDLDRIKVSVRPHLEWRQMFREAWRLQRDHYWREDMGGVDWPAIYDRYRPLVDRVATRSELSDLIWELQAELGTSHAYELGGDYGTPLSYNQGHLGIDWELDPDGHVTIDVITQGDRWDPASTSPLNRPGLDLRPGDRILTVDGQPVGRTDDGRVHSPGERLVNRADTEVELTVARGEDPAVAITVRTIADERPGRYRDWVHANRAEVHRRTDGRVGYLHIPDMLDRGFGEFHRGFLAELDRDALIVDVRFNAGGNVAPLVLEKLARRRRGHFASRRFGELAWPADAPRGPIVGITNQAAGSDGDMFSHTFKLMDLGPLIGTRTWGGVVGIWPRWSLADGTVTTQPEMHMTFDDIGRGLENRGADPDIEVMISPQEHARGQDPQLARAAQEATALLDGWGSSHPARFGGLHA